LNLLNNEINEILSKFPGLELKEYTDRIILIGKIGIDNTYKDEHIIDEYNVEVNIPYGYPTKLPTIKEIGKRIKARYGHIYGNRELCLATAADMQFKLGDNFKLMDWFENYVIPYFFSHSYFEKYGRLPFGDRSHGSNGMLEYYMEYFKADSKTSAYNILKYVCEKSYRGHNICPCGSKIRIRNCHKNIVIESQENRRIKILSKDLKDIEKERKR